MQHAVGMGGAADTDVIGEVEPALERAGRNAPVQIAAGVVTVSALGSHDKLMFLHLNRQVVAAETSYSDRNPIRGLIGFLDVVGRVGRRLYVAGQNPVHHVGKTVIANGCAVQRGKIIGSHVRSSSS